MSLFGWFSSLFGSNSLGGSHAGSNSSGSDLDDMTVNPANGLPMIGGVTGVDIEGNPYGMDSDSFNNNHINGMNDTDHFDHGSGFDEW